MMRFAFSPPLPPLLYWYASITLHDYWLYITLPFATLHYVFRSLAAAIRCFFADAIAPRLFLYASLFWRHFFRRCHTLRYVSIYLFFRRYWCCIRHAATPCSWLPALFSIFFAASLLLIDAAAMPLIIFRCAFACCRFSTYDIFFFAGFLPLDIFAFLRLFLSFSPLFFTPPLICHYCWYFLIHYLFSFAADDYAADIFAASDTDCHSFAIFAIIAFFRHWFSSFMMELSLSRSLRHWIFSLTLFAAASWYSPAADAAIFSPLPFFAISCWCHTPDTSFLHLATPDWLHWWYVCLHLP